MNDKPQRPSLYDPDVDVSTERNTGIGKLEKYINYARKLETYINYLEDERIAELEDAAFKVILRYRIRKESGVLVSFELPNDELQALSDVLEERN